MKRRIDLKEFEFDIPDPQTGIMKKQIVDTLAVKDSYATILGNSKAAGRELYERNKLGDKILEQANGFVDLTVDEHNKLEQSIDTFQGAIPRSHRVLLYRVYEAEEIADK